jgi:hypothetical protein
LDSLHFIALSHQRPLVPSHEGRSCFFLRDRESACKTVQKPLQPIEYTIFDFADLGISFDREDESNIVHISARIVKMNALRNFFPDSVAKPLIKIQKDNIREESSGH